MNIDTRTKSQKCSDWICHISGSWKFVGASTLFILVWVAWCRTWDPYPFILLNLVITTAELYQGPFIMMSQNRQQERDSENIEKILEAIHEMRNM